MLLKSSCDHRSTASTTKDLNLKFNAESNKILSTFSISKILSQFLKWDL